MQDLNDLYYYCKIVDHKGIAAAGRALNIPKSKLSRRLAALEERLGVRLIQRSTRRFDLTPIGELYFKHCKAMLVEAEAAERSIEMTHAEPCGLIRVSCPIALLHAHVGHMLTDFMLKFPKVTVQLEATNRAVDPIAEGLDIALRVRPLPLEDSELVLRILSDRGICLVADAKLVAAMGGLPKKPAELERWPSIVLGRSDQSFNWELYNDKNELFSQRILPRLVTTDMTLLKVAVMAGVGVAQLPHLLVREELAAGKVKRLLPDWAPKREVIHVVYPSRRGVSPAVRAFLDHLAESYAAFDEE